MRLIGRQLRSHAYDPGLRSGLLNADRCVDRLIPGSNAHICPQPVAGKSKPNSCRDLLVVCSVPSRGIRLAIDGIEQLGAEPTIANGERARLTFTYDADGRRTGITETAGATSTTTELRWADGRISAEYVDGVLTRSYVTDESGTIVKMVIASGPQAGTYLVTWNGHGDAVNLLELDGGTVTLANSFTYDTWGAALVHTHNGYTDLGFRFRYVGQLGVQDDSVLSLPLLLMGARHYAPALGRFIQPDPVAGEQNLYSYARSNPVSYVDPTGKWAFLVPLVAVAIRVAAAVATRALAAGPLITSAAAAASLKAPRVLSWATQYNQLIHICQRHCWGSAASASKFYPWMTWNTLITQAQYGSWWTRVQPLWGHWLDGDYRPALRLQRGHRRDNRQSYEGGHVRLAQWVPVDDVPGVSEVLSMTAMEEEIRRRLAAAATQMEAVLGISVDLTTMDTGPGRRHFGLEAYISSANDVLEFVIAVPGGEGNSEMEAYLGWQAAGEQIATWKLGPSDKGKYQLQALLDEGSKRIVELVQGSR